VGEFTKSLRGFWLLVFLYFGFLCMTGVCFFYLRIVFYFKFDLRFSGV